MCSFFVVHHPFSKPGSLIIQVIKNRYFSLCQRNQYSQGTVYLRGYTGLSWCDRRSRKSAHQIPKLFCSVMTVCTSTRRLSGELSKQHAEKLVVRLTPDEREALISALQQFQSLKIKTELEDQLAAFRWRNKFGRPSTISSLGRVDPTGSYCAVPDDWLIRKYAESVPQPCSKDLIRVLLANAIPFIGFGFLDNFIMIIAGDRIEACLGTVITLSTMAAAAIGNTFSDILGIGSAYYVELLAQKIGFKPPKLTRIQLDLPKSRLAANIGRVLGVTLGCVLGMSPLLFLHHVEEEKHASEETELPASENKTNQD